ALGAQNAALEFKLTATPANGARPVESRIVTVTVKAPADTAPPTVTAPTVLQGSSGNLRRNFSTTISTTAIDNVAVTSVTFFYSYTPTGGVKQTVSVKGNKSATSNTWSGTFTPTVAASYTFWSVASDAAGNVSPVPPAATVAYTTKPVAQ